MRTPLLCLSLVSSLILYSPAWCDPAYARGADVGWLSEMEAAGTKFYDSNGNAKDCLGILKAKGINSIRLRVWVNPTKPWCGKADVVAMAKRASAMGFRIMIDFHYSDFWADPQHQNKPAAWADHHDAQLAQDVYDHTYEVLKAIKDAGVTPEWVQVGNEITFGMLWPDGKTPHFAELVAQINKGYDAVKAVDPSMQVIIHLNNGADNGMFRKWFDQALADGVKFDVIGLSFYPDRKNWQDQVSHCLANMKDLASRYHKGVMLCEVGYFADDVADSKTILTELIHQRGTVSGQRNLGIFYWEPEGYTQKYNRNAWLPDGKPSPALDAFLTD